MQSRSSEAHPDGISRRRFLYGAVMGATAAALATKLGDSGAAVAAQEEDVEIVTGVLLDQRDGWLEIAQEGTPRTSSTARRYVVLEGGRDGPLCG